MEEQKIQVPIALVGESRVGKTCIIHRFIKAEYNCSPSTIGTAPQNRLINVNGIDREVVIWDTAGQETYKPSISFYIKKITNIIICFDPTVEDCEKLLIDWIKFIKETCGEPKIYLAATQSDKWNSNQMPTHINLNISDEACMKKYSAITLFTTSACTGEGIETMFEYVVTNASELPSTGLKINDKPEPKSGCC